MLLAFFIFAAVLFVAAMFNQPAAFFFLLWYSPLDQELPEGTPYRVVPVMLRFVAFLAVIAAYRLRKATIRSLFLGDTLSKLLLCWWADIVLSFMISRNYYDWGVRALLIAGSMFASYFVFRSWMRTEKKVQRTCLILSAIAGISGLLGIVQVMTGGYTALFSLLHLYSVEMTEWADRASGLSSAGPNAYAGFMNLYIPFGIGCMFCDMTRRHRVWIGFSLAFAAIGVLLSGCRGGVIALAATILMTVLAFVRGRMKWVLAVSLIVLVPMLALAAALLSPRLTDVDENESVLERYVIWAEALSLYQTHPITGIGLGNFRETYDAGAVHAAQGQLDVHNLYLQVLTETGLVGFSVFLTLFWYVGRRAYKNLKICPRGSLPRAISFATLSAIVSMFLHGAVDFLFLSGPEFLGGLAIVLATFSASLRFTSVNDFARQDVPEPHVPFAFLPDSVES